MSAIISEVTDNVVVLVPDSSVISTPDADNIIFNTILTDNITTENTSSIVVEVPITSIVAAGQPGPPGASSEEETMYAKQTDFVGDDIIYKGEAAVGSLTSAAAWRIRKLILSSDNDVSETWASGNANFDKVWDDRVSLSYT